MLFPTLNSTASESDTISSLAKQKFLLFATAATTCWYVPAKLPKNQSGQHQSPWEGFFLRPLKISPTISTKPKTNGLSFGLVQPTAKVCVQSLRYSLSGWIPARKCTDTKLTQTAWLWGKNSNKDLHSCSHTIRVSTALALVFYREHCTHSHLYSKGSPSPECYPIF